ncbi:helix-turn-helix transcriptional regulator [Paenibacillus kobensis]|uniref:helix-turn-helix transcriptional regulator n=1 Tax=Paenibacillus kobensis TaxID=59841 RepID=UPI000FDA7DBC
MARYETGRCLLPDRRRDCNNMSQQRLADLTGYSRSHVSAIERGLYEMKASEAMAFCSVLDCSFQSLYEWKIKR